MSAETDDRPPMTAAELNTHKVGEHERDYALSCDGYEDMEVAEPHGWQLLSSWGRDGWDLGEWPYVAVSTRTVSVGPRTPEDRRYELQQVVEGDHTQYAFGADEDRTAAIDYLFLWYAAGRSWAPLTEADRAALDRGEFAVGDKWRGPYTGRPMTPEEAEVGGDAPAVPGNDAAALADPERDIEAGA